MSKKALIPGPDRVRKIVALFQDSERKNTWTGGKAVISAQQMRDVIGTLGTDTPAWFQRRLDENYGHHGFLDYGEAKQILALIEALALKAQLADGSQGSQADQDGGKGVGAAPLPVGPTGAARAYIQGWLEDQVKLQQRQLKASLITQARSRQDFQRKAEVEGYAAALIKAAGAILDAIEGGKLWTDN